MTILREWRGRAVPENDDDVRRHYLEDVKPMMKEAPGLLRLSFAKRKIGQMNEYVLISLWRDMKSVEAFAGTVAEKAVLHERTRKVLTDSETFVRLFDVIDED